MKKFMSSIVYIILLGTVLLIPHNVWSTGFNSTATGGLWSDATTWVEGSAPVLGSSVTITQGSIVTVGAPFDIGTSVASNIALTINGCLDFPYDIDSGTWNIRGQIHLADQASGTPAKWTIGASTAPVLSTNTITLIHEGGATTRNCLFQIHQGVVPPVLAWYGSIVSSTTSNYPISARTITRVTTSSDSVVLDRDIDAKVGQEWILSPTEAVAQADTMTVVAYSVAATSITFNRNFTYAHNAGAYLINVSRNIIYKSTTTAQFNSVYIYKEGGVYTRGSNCDNIMQNVRIENIGSNGYSTWNNGWLGEFNGVVWYRSGYIYVNKASELDFNDCVVYYPRNGNCINFNSGGISGGINFRRVINLFNQTGQILALDGASSSLWEDCVIIGGQYGIGIAGTTDCTFRNTVAQCLTGALYGQLTTNAFTSNIIDSFTYINTAYTPSTANVPLFGFAIQQQSNFNDKVYNLKNYYTTPVYGVSTGLYRTGASWQGGEARFQNYNQEIGRNMVVGNSGAVYLESTTIRTAGSNGLRFDGESASDKGLAYTVIKFKVNCNTNDTILFRGYIQTNSSYGFAASSSPYVKVYTDNLSMVVNSTATTASQSGWELLTAGGTATSTGTVTVELAARLSSGCTAYFSDIKLYVGNGSYDLATNWVDGYPQASPSAIVMDATNLWAISTNTYTSQGTMGYNVGTNLDSKISGITVDTTTISNGVWGKNIYSTKDASTTLKEIRRREP